MTGEHLSDCPALLHVRSQDNCEVLLPGGAASALYWTARHLMSERTLAGVQNVKLGGHPTCLSINRLWHELCDMLRRLVGTTAPGHHDCSIQIQK
ncbi:hypothetical protein TNCV_591931 [Trichonephila clavipes]|nr:hypothetical protein TNCV_591931 [Trichonephila clavipes]